MACQGWPALGRGSVRVGWLAGLGIRTSAGRAGNLRIEGWDLRMAGWDLRIGVRPSVGEVCASICCPGQLDISDRGH